MCKTGKDNNGGIHCVGNGKIIAYGEGADIKEIFGPPYSSPPWLSVTFEAEQSNTFSQRETGAAIWKHEIHSTGKKTGEMLDFAIDKEPCIIRKIKAIKPIELIFTFHEMSEILETTEQTKGYGASVSYLIKIKPGDFIYGNYPTHRALYHQLTICGNIETAKTGQNTVKVKFFEGESTIYMTGGPEYLDCIKTTKRVLNRTYDSLLDETRNGWRFFTQKKSDFSKLLADDAPRRNDLLESIDDISVLIKTQQSEEGGILAGHNYHLCYVRDQYGASRCLLRLGYLNEAKAILEYYFRIWRKHGCVHNVQAAGVDGLFHVHENDDVEITGYLIIQAFDYLKASKDKGFLIEIFPMMEWAWEAQKKNIINNMLPFNGDETYIAGGLLPRTALNDGSAEATMLFLRSGEMLTKWICDNKLWVLDKVEAARKVLSCIKNRFRNNYIINGKIIANNINRLSTDDWPEFRHGVCQNCYSFGWTRKNKKSYYLCPECIDKLSKKDINHKEYHIYSVSLFPKYIGSDIFSDDEIKDITSDIIGSYKKTGKLCDEAGEDRLVGYDYGFFLHTLTEIGHPLAQNVYKMMLDIRDERGAWVEYYENGEPNGTKCRPWESGMNLEAAINYALSYH